MVSSPAHRPLPPEPSLGRLRAAAPRDGSLDPGTAYQVHDQPGVRETVFVADALLVRGRHPDTYAALEAVAAEAGFELARDEGSALGREVLDQAPLTPEQRSQLEAVWVERVRLSPRRDRPESVFRPIDTWRLLQNYRARVGRDSPRHGDVGLEHPASSADVQPDPVRTRTR